MTDGFISSPLYLFGFFFLTTHGVLRGLFNLSGGHAERVGSMLNEKTGENKKNECACCVGPADVAEEDLGSSPFCCF